MRNTVGAWAPCMKVVICGASILLLLMGSGVGCGSDDSRRKSSRDTGHDVAEAGDVGDQRDADGDALALDAGRDTGNPGHDAGRDSGGTEYTIPPATIVSRSSTGELVEAAPDRFHPRELDVSADGRWVLFRSRSEGLVGPGSEPECFLHDAHNGETRRISTGPGSLHACRLSRNGEVVAFIKSNDGFGLSLYDVATRETSELFTSSSLLRATDLTLSPNGRWMAYTISDSLLDPRAALWDLEDDTAPVTDFPSNSVLSVTDAGQVLVMLRPNTLDGDNDYQSPNLYLFEPTEESLTLLTETATGTPTNFTFGFQYARLAPDGAWMSFSGRGDFLEGLEEWRIWVRPGMTGAWTAVLPEIEGASIQGGVSGLHWGPTHDLRYYFFEAPSARYGYNHWRWDTETGAAIPFAAHADGLPLGIGPMDMSDDGRVVVFMSADAVANVGEEPPFGTYVYRVELP